MLGVKLFARVHGGFILLQGGKPISEPLQSRADQDTRISFRRAKRQPIRQNIWNQIGPNCRKQFDKEARRDSLPIRFPEERHCEYPR